MGGGQLQHQREDVPPLAKAYAEDLPTTLRLDRVSDESGAIEDEYDIHLATNRLCSCSMKLAVGRRRFSLPRPTRRDSSRNAASATDPFHGESAAMRTI